MREIGVIVDSGLFVLIWLVQLVIYPSFYHIEKINFGDYHSSYVRRISLIVGPLILSQIAVELFYFVNYDVRWLRLIMIAATILVTFTLSVPCHRMLSDKGKDRKVISRLLTTNWLRTALWSALFFDTVVRLYIR